MADIKFLQDIDFTGVTSKNFVVESENAPGAGAVTGQIIFDTTGGANKLAYYNGSSWVQVPAAATSYSWTAKADSGSDETISNTNSIDFAGGTGISTTISSANGAKTITFAASGSGSMSSFTVAGDTGANQTIEDGNTLSLVGATNGGIATVGAATDNVTFAMDVPDLTETSTWNSEQDYFAVSDNTDTRKIASSNIRVGDFDNTMASQRLTNVSDPSAAQDAATKAYVDASVAGGLTVKGGFNANTGAITSGGNLTTGGSRVAIAVGDYYVVTVAGDFFGNSATPLTPGDSVLVQTAAAAGASVEGDFAVIQSDTDIATATTIGLASFPSSVFTITSGGAVGLADQFAAASTTAGSASQIPTVTVNADGIVTALTGTNVTIPKPGITMTTASSGGGTTSLTYTHNLGATCIVQVYERGGDPVKPLSVVYPDIEYVSDNAIKLNFAASQSATAFEVCIEPLDV